LTTATKVPPCAIAILAGRVSCSGFGQSVFVERKFFCADPNSIEALIRLGTKQRHQADSRKRGGEYCSGGIFHSDRLTEPQKFVTQQSV
jgi:hypothetical protein